MKSLAKLFLINGSLVNTAAAEICAAVITVLVVPSVRKGNGSCTLGSRRIVTILDKLPAFVYFKNFSHKISFNGF
jgi:hypothetical protein